MSWFSHQLNQKQVWWLTPAGEMSLNPDTVWIWTLPGLDALGDSPAAGGNVVWPSLCRFTRSPAGGQPNEGLEGCHVKWT